MLQKEALKRILNKKSVTSKSQNKSQRQSSKILKTNKSRTKMIDEYKNRKKKQQTMISSTDLSNQSKSNKRKRTREEQVDYNPVDDASMYPLLKKTSNICSNTHAICISLQKKSKQFFT